MHARVTAILVARNGAEFLERTISALARQSRRPDSVVFVDAGSSDSSPALLAAGEPTQFVTTAGRRGFGSAVAHAVSAAVAPASDDEWLWLLAHDNAPEPLALAALLGAVEIAPSVAIAGPKLMGWDRRDVIADYGQTMTTLGNSIHLVENELDQAQHDRESDLLAVAGSGMLVRRSVWSALGGFDPALPSIDAALDFCIRARLAGHRVVGVPEARVASAGGPELFGRTTVSTATDAHIRRSAQLHRRLAYAPAVAVPLHWLSLLPLAILRSAWHLIAKRPGAITAEFSAAFAAAVDAGVAPARRNIARNRVLGWGAISPFRMPPRQVRERRANARDEATAPAHGAAARVRPSFFGNGGAWIVILMVVVGVVAFLPLLGATALTGGGIVPLSGSAAELWANVGYGWREVGVGFVGASDPFAYVLAVLGSTTFWAPSLSIVVLYVCALPLAALGAWWAAARFSERGWAPATAAILWSLSPSFLTALTGGHLGAVLAHLLLPWLALALLGAARSWAAAGAAGLLLAATIACAPSLAPALLVCWIALMVTHPRSAHRLLGIVMPTLVLFAPLVLQQGMRGNWLALFADPGVPVAGGTASGWQLAIGSPDGGYNGWLAITHALGLPPLTAAVVVAILLAPLAALALLALFLPGSRRSIPAVAVALLGFVTALASAHLAVTIVGSTSTIIWPGSGISLFWLGLVGAAVLAINGLTSSAALPALLVGFASAILAVPLIAAPLAGTAAVEASNGRLLPAFVSAEAVSKPTIGTLEISAIGGGYGATLHRGEGTTLDDQSTIAATQTEVSEEQERLAILTGNLVTRSGFDSAAELQALQIGFVLVPDARKGEAADARRHAAEALDGNAALTAIGDTAHGYLWHYAGLQPAKATQPVGALEKAIGFWVLLVQAIVFAGTFLLALPTRTRGGRAAGSGDEEPASTFEEEDHA